MDPHSSSQPPALRPVVDPEPDIRASVANIRAAEVRWYLPTWSERLRFIGWRLIYFLPAPVILAAMAGMFFIPHWRSATGPVMVLWWKLLVVAIGLPLAAGVKAARDALRARTEPFCIHCGYTLVGLPDHHNCPECGEPFDHAVIDEYRRDPHAFIERYQRVTRLPTAEHVPFNAGKVPSPRSSDGT